MAIKVYPNKIEASKAVANHIGDLIRERQKENRQAVLGLATGSSPIYIYEELVRMHQEEGLSFANVVSFNLDEYYPMEPTAVQSYVKFMQQHLFRHIDIPAQQIHIPDGSIAKEDIAAYCRAYDEKIQAVGGIDIQLLGIGRTGHIGFNEPPVGADSTTRLVALHELTIEDAAKDFDGISTVPTHAITMGVSTILAAREIILVGWGKSKASIVQRAIEGAMSDEIPASYLQMNPNVIWVLDKEAAGELHKLKIEKL